MLQLRESWFLALTTNRATRQLSRRRMRQYSGPAAKSGVKDFAECGCEKVYVGGVGDAYMFA